MPQLKDGLPSEARECLPGKVELIRYNSDYDCIRFYEL